MKALGLNWVTEGLIDFEYKKYVLLDFLQSISKDFDERKIYPGLSGLIDHYSSLFQLKQNKALLNNSFPQQLSKIDFEKFRLQFEKLVEDESNMQEIESIIDFALPQLYNSMNEGKELYQWVEDKLSIFPVGIIPINTENGYMFLSQSASKDIMVYEYMITIFENSNEKFRGIKTNFVTSYYKSIATTYESVKGEMIKNHRDFPNPATFLIESSMDFPLKESLLPVAKRSLVRYLYKNIIEGNTASA